MAWVASQPLEGASAAERMQRIEELARQLNRLKLEDRATVLFNLLTSDLYGQISDPELARFLEMILPPGIMPMLKAFDNFSPESRRRYLDSAVIELEASARRYNRPIRGRLPKDALDRIVRDGATAYLRGGRTESPTGAAAVHGADPEHHPAGAIGRRVHADLTS